MTGLAIVLVLIVIVHFATTLDITKASEESQEEREDKKVNLINIPTPEQKAADKKLKELWLLDFSQLLRESNNGDGID